MFIGYGCPKKCRTQSHFHGIMLVAQRKGKKRSFYRSIACFSSARLLYDITNSSNRAAPAKCATFENTLSKNTQTLQHSAHSAKLFFLYFQYKEVKKKAMIKRRTKKKPFKMKRLNKIGQWLGMWTRTTGQHILYKMETIMYGTVVRRVGQTKNENSRLLCVLFLM